MKVLFVPGKQEDYLGSTLWDGLQELLGEDNVYDAGPCPSLHKGYGDGPCSRISNSREGMILGDEGDFDLMVLCAFFLRDGLDWHYPIGLRGRLRPGAKVAYVDGFDGPEWIEPRMPVDKCFKLEIDPSRDYVGRVLPLHFGVPRRFFHGGDNNERVYDVMATHALVNDVRWQVMQRIWQTTRRHRSITATGGFLSLQQYDDYIRNTKMMICPPGAGSDCLRQWEAIAGGCIPVFVGHPARVRDPDWFQWTFTASLESLPNLIDEVLSFDQAWWNARRAYLREFALENHTTAARAQRLLNVMRF